MKVVLSLGGPLVGIDRALMDQWCGIEVQNFSGSGGLAENDYEAAGLLTDGVEHAPCSISMIEGPYGIALLIAAPLETAVISSSVNGAFIAQILYGNPEWSFELLVDRELNELFYENPIPFKFFGNELVFFDTSYSGRDVGNDLLSLKLEPGEYVFSASPLQEEDDAGLIIYKIERL